jgi:hypothetical protein
MKWRIKNPAPSDDRREKWGDFHFGQSLADALRRLGQEVETDYHAEWGSEAPCDVVLVLRGKHAYQFDGRHGKPIHVMWNISHPADVGVDEYRRYDRVFVASSTRAEALASDLPGRIDELLQCTDTRRFRLPEEADHEPRRGIVFVGNTRSQQRELIIGLAQAGVPLRIWGRGWRNHGLAQLVVDEYIDNRSLGDLYGEARVCVNDHWPDMIEHGFINNRLFDALACGLPVLSDPHPEIARTLGEEAVVQAAPGDAVSALGRLLLRYPSHLGAARRASATIRRSHSFDERARTLLEAVS